MLLDYNTLKEILLIPMFLSHTSNEFSSLQNIATESTICIDLINTHAGEKAKKHLLGIE